MEVFTKTDTGAVEQRRLCVSAEELIALRHAAAIAEPEMPAGVAGYQKDDGSFVIVIVEVYRKPEGVI